MRPPHRAGTACEMFVGTLRDSICRNSGSGMDLPIARQAPGRSIFATSQLSPIRLPRPSSCPPRMSGFNYVIDAKNTIALSGGGADVHADQSEALTATINDDGGRHGDRDPTGHGNRQSDGSAGLRPSSAGNLHQTPRRRGPVSMRAASSEPAGNDGHSVCAVGRWELPTAPPHRIFGADELNPCVDPNNNFANAQASMGAPPQPMGRT